MKIVYSICLLSIISGSLFSQAFDFDVLRGWRMFQNTEHALYEHISNECLKLIEEREKIIAQLKTKSDWENRQTFIKKTLLDIIGPFPAKNPLNARTVETIQRDGYHIEKVLFESRPGYLVTGVLFVPEKIAGKAPAILYCAGHASQRVAFRSPSYQEICINFAKRGFVVFAFDPADQGERHQYWESELGGNLIGRPTQKHSYVGSQCFMTGSSLARYSVWDGIRSIDYLVSRKEVDPNRIGVTGQSGGGTQTVYISALDERVLASAPSNWVTSRKRLLQSIGPQDAEQNLYKELASGLDVADLLTLRAPKPTLMITTTQDFFNIMGSIEVENEVRKAYKAFGKDALLTRIEDDAPHINTLKNREKTTAFFQKYLNHPGDSQNLDVEIIPISELYVTKNGILPESYASETVYSLNKSEAETVLIQLDASRHKNGITHLENALNAAKILSGFRKPDLMEEAVFTGRFIKPDYAVEKYFIKGEGNYPIPFLLFVPNEIQKPPVLYLHEEGKAWQYGRGKEVEWMLKRGHVVLTPDVLGMGELGHVFKKDPPEKKYGIASTSDWFQSVLLGRSITGIHAGDIMRLITFLENKYNTKEEGIYAMATGILCPSLLHAASFDETISRLALVNPLISYGSIVTHKYYNTLNIYTAVPGAIQKYDLVDLEASLAPRRLLMINMVDHIGNLARTPEIEKEMKFVRDQYGNLNAGANFEIKKLEPYQNLTELLVSWID